MDRCGRWPLLLRLVNGILLDRLRSQTDVDAVAGEILERLRAGKAGPTVDGLTGAADLVLDVNKPEQRDMAVATTVEASTGLLGNDDRGRFTELAIFVEDEVVPVTLIAALWWRTGQLDAFATGALCARLADLALLNLTATADGGTISLHDVVRDRLHDEIGPQKAAELHQSLIGIGRRASSPRRRSPGVVGAVRERSLPSRASRRASALRRAGPPKPRRWLQTYVGSRRGWRRLGPSLP